MDEVSKGVRREKVVAAVMVAAAVGLWAVFILPGCCKWCLEDDTAFFSYISQRLLAGDILYRDVWDHKGPVIFLIDVAGLWLGGGRYAGIVAVEFILMSITSVLVFFTLRRYAGRLAAGFAAICLALAVVGPLGEGNFTEEYAVFFQAVALFGFVRLEENAGKRTAWCSLAIGLSGSLAFFMRPNLIGLWIVIAGYWILKGLAGKDLKTAEVRLKWALVPFAAMLVALVAYFGYYGPLREFLDALIFHNSRYTQLSGQPFTVKLAGMCRRGFEAYPFLPLSLLGAGITIIEYARKRSPEGGFFTMVFVWLIVEVLLASLGGWSFAHYAIPWAIPATCLAVFFLCRVGQWLIGRYERLSAGKMAAFVLLAIALMAMRAGAFRNSWMLIEDRHTRLALADYIASSTRPDETVYLYESYDRRGVWHGSDALSTMFMAGRKLPTPYVNPTFWYAADDMMRKRMKDTLYENWLKRPPAIVVISSFEDHEYFRIDPRIRELVLNNYHLAGRDTLWNWQIYLPNN